MKINKLNNYKIMIFSYYIIFLTLIYLLIYLLIN